MKRYSTIASLVATASATSLADICTVSNVQAALPSDGTILGVNFIPSAVTASPVYNATSGTSTTALTYCNVTVTYEHAGENDETIIKLALPQPSDYKGRWYVGGGGGYSLSSDATGGITYGAASGATSAGYDAFEYSVDEVFLLANGTIDWDPIHAFGYKALGEMTVVAKAILPEFYGSSNITKLYTYYEGCSDGGREGMSQIQRWGEEYDGVITGAPAFRYAQQVRKEQQYASKYLTVPRDH